MEWFLNLKIENQIAIISSFATIFISIVSVWIALKAMKITKQSTLDANRPYVVVHFEVVDVGYYRTMGNQELLSIQLNVIKNLTSLT